MTRNVYALLVGIDEYVAPISALRGCVNDMTAMSEYLVHRVASEQGYQLHMRSLKNQEATRQAIIDNFRQHLCQASSNDIVIFYFCGHGSQEPAPSEWWYLEPDCQDETLVCWDSRIEGSWDLADKELAKLISEVARNNPHIVVILDCCHSGSGSREDWEEIGIRRASSEKRQRPLDSFIFSLDEVESLSNNFGSENSSANWLILPEGEHILLAACQDKQTAKELYIDGKIRGAFSYYLQDTLQKANKAISYRDLFKRTDALVRSKVNEQSPQVEANESFSLAQPFLGGAIAKCNPYFTVTHHKKYGWVIDGGAVHNIPQGSDNELTQLALFPFDSNPQQLRQLSNAFGQAVVTKVLPHLSQVDINGIENLNSEMTFKAVVTNLPLLPIGIYLQGEKIGVEILRNYLLNPSQEEQPCLYISEVDTVQQAEIRVTAKDEQYLIEVKGTQNKPSLINEIRGYTQQHNAVKVVEKLIHIARWIKTLELSNPAKSSFLSDAVTIQIFDSEGKEIKSSNINFEYCYQNGEWKEPTFRLKLKNNTHENLYCALLNLTETYGIFTPFFATGGQWLEAGQEAWAYRGRPIPARVEDKFWEQGITEFRDILMLIVSTAEFDARLLKQEDIELSNSSHRVDRGETSTYKGILNQLMNRISHRHLGTYEEKFLDDWDTKQIIITSLRPKGVFVKQ